ncbi:hypothetical protein AYL99_05303 [Fonsecaea erecta]|uniref:tyrosinase n=1 Tax=Fonsecaea erecta TaxID=1367422 RepID=A0A178ZLD8_9EURO|nr:hypothetical protein AYL99_05303 [Fonsecaea erecta]OAP60301.1 hypothetical protein AYL99_05303 [Fonsecaea erecta]
MAPSEAELNAGVVFGIGALNHDEVRARLDIDVMIAKQPDVFNLFLLALMDLKADTSKLGYFSLAGDSSIESMDFPQLFGMAWERPSPKEREDTVHTDGLSSQHGTDLTWLFLRCELLGACVMRTWRILIFADVIQQTLFRKMMAVVREFDRAFQSKYLTAARAFRLPYWDYFRPRDVDAKFPGIKLEGNRTRHDYDFRMPDILNVREVMVRVPPYDKLTVQSNPLYNFKFTDRQNLDKDLARARLTNYNPNRTVRYPRSKDSKYHDVQQLSDALNSGREGRASMMLDILDPGSTRYPRLGDVASDSVLREGDLTQTGLSKGTAGILPRDGNGRPASYGSIEALHGNYHTLMGGPNGHMSSPSVAAFDPVFWLHHCNVDRIFAIWQALHPKAWFPPPGKDARGRRLKPENEKDLLPFYKFICDLGPIYYDSDWARDIESFGYTYPDLDRVSDPKVIWSRVYRRYIWSIRSASSRRFSTPPSDMMPLNLNRAQVFRYPAANSKTSTAEPPYSVTTRIVFKRVTSSGPDTLTTEQLAAQDRGYVPAPDNDVDPSFDREWYIDNVVKRNALNGPFTIYFFLCPKSRFPDDPAEYVASPYLAGINHIFAAPREVCDNCGQQDAAGVLASDTVPITPLLLDYVGVGTLESMRAEHVRPFLVKYLRWRVVYAGISRADPRQMPNFEVSVSAKILYDDGSATYEAYPDVVDDIIYNAS